MDQTDNDGALQGGAPREDAADARAVPEEETAGYDAETNVEDVVDWTQRIEELQTQADDYKDKYLRSVAEFSNYRKRQERERQQQTWRIQAGVLRGLLDPLDDFRRALDHVPSGEMDSGWVQGIMLIEQKLLGLLSQYNVTQMNAVGQPFDPSFHDALLREPSDLPEGTVTEEVRKGYLMDDQVLRPAVVKVSQGPEEPEQ